MLRVLVFKANREELTSLTGRHLTLGIASTWVVGMGRWWEDPKASLLQHLGLGSLIYVVLLSFLLWLVLLSLTSKVWSYLDLLTFVTLTSPPALLYALPVRSWLPLGTGQQIRFWLLAIVAIWRVLLWARYLYVGVGLAPLATLVTTLLPLTLVIATLSTLNLERVVFDLMGGIRPDHASVNDAAYGVLFLLTIISVLLVIPLLLVYVILAVQSRRKRSGASGGRLPEGG